MPIRQLPCRFGMDRVVAQMDSVGTDSKRHIRSSVYEQAGAVRSDCVKCIRRESDQRFCIQVLLTDLNRLDPGFSRGGHDLERALATESFRIGDEIGAEGSGQSNIPSIVVLAEA